MNQEQIFQILRKPHISEKSSIVGDAHNQVVFEVAPGASKPEIKAAVAALFEVKVQSVTTVNTKPKMKRFRGRPGKRSGWKKAYVTLAQGETIDFLDGAA